MAGSGRHYVGCWRAMVEKSVLGTYCVGHVPAVSLLGLNLDFYSLGGLLRPREVTGHVVNEETERDPFSFHWVPMRSGALAQVSIAEGH